MQTQLYTLSTCISRFCKHRENILEVTYLEFHTHSILHSILSMSIVRKIPRHYLPKHNKEFE